MTTEGESHYGLSVSFGDQYTNNANNLDLLLNSVPPVGKWTNEDQYLPVFKELWRHGDKDEDDTFTLPTLSNADPFLHSLGPIINEVEYSTNMYALSPLSVQPSCSHLWKGGKKYLRTYYRFEPFNLYRSNSSIADFPFSGYTHMIPAELTLRSDSLLYDRTKEPIYTAKLKLLKHQFGHAGAKYRLNASVETYYNLPEDHVSSDLCSGLCDTRYKLITSWWVTLPELSQHRYRIAIREGYQLQGVETHDQYRQQEPQARPTTMEEFKRFPKTEINVECEDRSVDPRIFIYASDRIYHYLKKQLEELPVRRMHSLLSAQQWIEYSRKCGSFGVLDPCRQFRTPGNPLIVCAEEQPSSTNSTHLEEAMRQFVARLVDRRLNLSTVYSKALVHNLVEVTPLDAMQSIQQPYADFTDGLTQ